jgi:uncharacterized RDD family membrane protein YckC
VHRGLPAPAGASAAISMSDVQSSKPGSDALPPAGLLRRLGAILYDSLLLAALCFAVTAAAIALRRGAGIAPGSGWFQLLIGTICWLYFAWSWVHGAQTVGMRAWKIAVCATGGGEVGWRRATIRFVSAWISAAALGLGFLWSLIDSEHRCWHDRWSGTKLVRLRPESRRSDTG